MKNDSLFHSAREAKEFLVSKIVQQAQHDGYSFQMPNAKCCISPKQIGRCRT
jgi:hypothetical protein